jgi:DtxR family manganese transport transcriptional regulator
MYGKVKGTSRSQPQRQQVADGYRRVRADHATELAEDYVELIDDLISETGEARAVDLANALGVSHVTVTKAVARLQRDGLVTSAPYRSIFLTDEGRKLANASRERHRLVVQFLMAVGVPERDAEADAEGIEHHISPATLSAMKRYLK